MYQDELYREAALIVRGRQAYVDDVANAWSRIVAWLGLKG